MIQDVTNIQEMNKELRYLCAVANMKFECGAGGAFNSPIAFVAEAPGEREVSLATPLCGNSGKLLWETTRNHGFTRNNVYMTNVIKHRQESTAQARTAASKRQAGITKQALDSWTRLLHTELKALPNLRYVVALGSYAIHALVGEKGVTNWRGSAIDVKLGDRTITVLCTFNPAAVIHDPKLAIIFRLDLAKLPRIVKGTFKCPEINTIINPSYSDAMDYIDLCYRSRDPVGIDIELLGGETACVGLAATVEQAMCINWRTQNKNRYTTREELALRLRIQKLVGDEKVRLVAQNGNFDSYWLYYKDRIKIHRIWFDTMLAHHVLLPPLPHNLGFITSQYTDHPFYKDEGQIWKTGVGDIDNYWRYNGKDCCITLLAHYKMRAELIDQHLDDFFFNHVMRLQRHLVDMTVMGVKCDVQLKESFNADLAVVVAQAKQLCQDTAREATGISDYNFNPNAPGDISKLLFNDLKLVGRGNSTDAENRKRMLNHPRTNDVAKSVIAAIDNFKRDSKFRSTYTNSRIGEDGRFRCEYKQTGVSSAPGRLSSAQLMDGEGMNLQNIPERFKVMFEADEGYELSYFDMAQVEARFVACLANISVWLEQFERARTNPGSYDAHCALASVMFGVPYDDVPREDFTVDPTTGLSVPTIRYMAKRSRHGLNYRMQPDRLATTAGIPIRAAQENFTVYHRKHPEIRQWWDDIIDEVRRTGRLLSPLGRRWLLLEPLTDTALESVVAFKPQSTAGDHVASVIYKCHEDPRWPTELARIILNIHDALIALNKPEVGPLVRSIMRTHAEAPIVINGHTMITPADFKVSTPDEKGMHRWSTLKKVKPPLVLTA